MQQLVLLFLVQIFTLSSVFAVSKALLLVANGSEDIEVVTVVDVLGRAGVLVDTIKVPDPSRLDDANSNQVVLMQGTVLAAMSVLSSQVDISDYDTLIIPGGAQGASIMKSSSPVLQLVESAFAFSGNLKIVAAICLGPTVLQAAKVGFGRKLTSYPSAKDVLSNDYNYVENTVVVDDDGHLITSRGPGTAMQFALAVASALVDQNTSANVASGLLFQNQA